MLLCLYILYILSVSYLVLKKKKCFFTFDVYSLFLVLTSGIRAYEPAM